MRPGTCSIFTIEVYPGIVEAEFFILIWHYYFSWDEMKHFGPKVKAPFLKPDFNLYFSITLMSFMIHRLAFVN